jgi:CheY-like chemotaxis protein
MTTTRDHLMDIASARYVAGSSAENDRVDTIMIVEDNGHIRSNLAEILRDEGYRVVTAREGGEALRWMRSARVPSVILLDLLMTGMNGWEFRSRQLQDPKLAGVPVIIVSGLAEVRRHAAYLDVPDHFGKPIALERLLETVHRHCSALRHTAHGGASGWAAHPAT